jgi:hypothetical protein
MLPSFLVLSETFGGRGFILRNCTEYMSRERGFLLRNCSNKPNTCLEKEVSFCGTVATNPEKEVSFYGIVATNPEKEVSFCGIVATNQIHVRRKRFPSAES